MFLRVGHWGPISRWPLFRREAELGPDASVPVHPRPTLGPSLWLRGPWGEVVDTGLVAYEACAFHEA